MSLSKSLNSILGPIFDEEFYPVVHPDPEGKAADVVITYGIYNIVGGATFVTLEGVDDLVRPRVQISIYAIDYDDLKAKEVLVAEAMKTANTITVTAIENREDPFAAEGGLVNVLISVPTDGFEKDTKRFYSHSEFYCWIRN